MHTNIYTTINYKLEHYFQDLTIIPVMTIIRLLHNLPSATSSHNQTGLEDVVEVQQIENSQLSISFRNQTSG